jgi:hypothetical protein
MDLIFEGRQLVRPAGQWPCGASFPVGTSQAGTRAADRATAAYITMGSRKGGLPVRSGPPFLWPLLYQSAGGCSVMAMVPVKISSLTMKAIAVT